MDPSHDNDGCVSQFRLMDRMAAAAGREPNAVGEGLEKGVL